MGCECTTEYIYIFFFCLFPAVYCTRADPNISLIFQFAPEIAGQTQAIYDNILSSIVWAGTPTAPVCHSDRSTHSPSDIILTSSFRQFSLTSANTCISSAKSSLAQFQIVVYHLFFLYYI